MQVDIEYDSSWAWLGEYRNGALHVTRVSLKIDDIPVGVYSDQLRLEVEQHGVFSSFSHRRFLALQQVFTDYRHFESGTDYWAGGPQSFSGSGYSSIRTIVPIPDDALNHIVKRLTDNQLPLGIDGEAEDLEPIEFMLPWLLSNYYSQ